MVMEPMSEGSAGVREGMERGKLRGGVRGGVRGTGVGVGDEGGWGKRKRGEEEGRKRKSGGEEKEGEERKKRRVRGPKGPNPLSVRKAKRKGEGVEKAVGKEGGDGVVSNSKRKAGEAREGRAERVLDGEEVQDSAGIQKKRKRKHKSGAPATGDGDTTTADAILD